MTTITIKIDERFSIKKIVTALRTLKGVKQIIINEEKEGEKDISDEEFDRIMDSIPFEPIPGLPYTHEERMESLRQAIDDFERGVPGIPHEDVMKEMNSWF